VTPQLPPLYKQKRRSRLATCGLYSGMAIMALSLLLFQA
jgi:hypothetical protein